MRNQFLKFFLLVLASSSLFAACETEPDTFEVTGDLTYFIPSGDDEIKFQVDSVIFDPSIGGTAKIRSTSTWTLEAVEASSDSQSFFVTVQGSDTGSVARQRYIWDFQTSGVTNGSHLSQLDGFSYVNLVTPFTAQTTWDALQVADRDLVITVAGEPISIHKDWTSASIDSIGPYRLPDGSVVDAVYVSLSSAENLIELREYKEIYGKGFGLLERTQRILDTQQAASTAPWEEKAENGFTVNMKRLF